MTQSPTVRLLAVSGSLRARSANTAVLQALQSLAPVGVVVTLYRSLGDLPHFNPDLDTATPPAAVVAWREAVTAAQALVIINARPGADFAQASLRETLSAMNARLLDNANVTLPLTSNTLDAAALLALPVVRTQLAATLTALTQAGL